MHVKLLNIQCLIAKTLAIHSQTCLAFNYKVVAEMCLEPCLVPKHSFYSERAYQG